MSKTKMYNTVELLKYIFILMTIIAIVLNIIGQEWIILSSSFLTLFMFLMPDLYSKWAKIHIPALLKFIILVFIFASMYLGEIHSYFYRYSWWDSMLHVISAMFWGFVGFILIYTMNKNKKMDDYLSPGFIAFFTFCFSLTMSVIWEIMEFIVDSGFGGNMQKARDLHIATGIMDTRLGLFDTMRDIVVDAVGALIFAIVTYRHLKIDKKKINAAWNIKDQFIEENDNLFKTEDKIG